MNTQLANKITTRTLREAAAAVGLLLIFFTIQNVGQKEVFEARRATSRDGLMDTGYLTKADVSDDLDGTVTEEKVAHDAGAPTSQSLTVEELCRLIREAGRRPVERDTVFNTIKEW